MQSAVDIGFVEVPDQPWLLHRKYFPSKVGGKAAWLDPKMLPDFESMLCVTCSKPMAFLLQLYAPNEASVNGFHRIIYLFCCKNNKCYQQENNSPIGVFRCTLPRKNLYYDFEPPNYDEPVEYQQDEMDSNLCQVCGCLGKKTCSRCKSIKYCGRDHQVLHWKKHKLACNNSGQFKKESPDNSSNSFLFPENEIVIEPEDIVKSSNSGSIDVPEVSKLEPNTREFNEKDLDDVVGLQKEDSVFMKFKKRISYNQEQVVRYERDGKPFWCSDQFVPKINDIPPCNCGASRFFEFQVMPHLLSYLNVDSSIEGPTIDWGTIAVYTCSADCVAAETSTSAYVREFAWKQNYSKKSVHSTVTSDPSN